MKTTLVLLLSLSSIFINAYAIESSIYITKKHENQNAIKVALLLDTSNSMDGLIDQAKAQLWEIINELSYAKCDDVKPSLVIALYEYGNNNLNSREGYIRKVTGFTSDLDIISKELFSLTTNGGEEYCGYVIHSSLQQLDWGINSNDLKLIFIAGNEPFNQGNISYKTATELACSKDVSINTIFCGDYNLGVSSLWKDGANAGHGDYIAINHNQATVHIPSPYDDKILELNTKLNNTYVAYGRSGKSKMALQAEQDTNAYSYGQANAVSRTVSKSSHLYKNSTWDLVDAVEEEIITIDEIKNTDLPKELKSKSKKELKVFLETKQNERKKITEEIQLLNIKRKEYLSSKKTENQLQNAMISALKSQAQKKNYQW